MPEDLSSKGLEGAGDLFEKDAAAESAATLGRAGQLVERTLAELAAYRGSPEGRERLLKAAAEAVYWYLIQREALGQTNHDQAIRLYGIPNEVMARLGRC